MVKASTIGVVFRLGVLFFLSLASYSYGQDNRLAQRGNIPIERNTEQSQALKTPLPIDRESDFLNTVKEKRLHERRSLPEFVHTDYSEVMTIKSLGSAIDGETLLLSATTFAAQGRKQKQLYLYENAFQAVTVTTHDNPNDFYTDLASVTGKYDIAISLETEAIAGTYHVFNRLPVRVNTEVKPFRDLTRSKKDATLHTATDQYEFSLQLEGRHRRYQLARVRFTENLLAPPRLTKVYYAPLSYVMAFIISYQYYQENRLVIKEKVIFSDAKKILVGTAYEVLRQNEYKLLQPQQNMIFQKWITFNKYRAAYYVTFDLLSGVRIERVVSGEGINAVKSFQTLADIKTVFP
ncbi:hypothetical protein COTS27_01504 [Spirochaetota bacterium]|nr:hypothetical protein COTS27_01504 [Spirochaetota bacterium]